MTMNDYIKVKDVFDNLNSIATLFCKSTFEEDVINEVVIPELKRMFEVKE